MNVALSGAREGHHTAAARLAEAVYEAVHASLALDGGNLHDDALDAVAGGFTPDDIYLASAGFFADWRADSSAHPNA